MQPATQLPQELQSGNCEQPELPPPVLLPFVFCPTSLTGVAQLAAPNASAASPINMSFMMELSPSLPKKRRTRTASAVRPITVRAIARDHRATFTQRFTTGRLHPAIQLNRCLVVVCDAPPPAHIHAPCRKCAGLQKRTRPNLSATRPLSARCGRHDDKIRSGFRRSAARSRSHESAAVGELFLGGVSSRRQRWTGWGGRRRGQQRLRRWQWRDESGTGGASAECDDDTDCDDGKACNGNETCNAGKCAAGTPPPCNNPDTDHCEALCQEPSGTCVIRGKDADGDTYRDALCAASSPPGDDCDDSNKDAYPGAAEVCDGVDNDCNGKDELEEGTPAVGIVSKFDDGLTADIDWSPAAKQYGVAWADGLGAVFYVGLSPSGTKKGNRVFVGPRRWSFANCLEWFEGCRGLDLRRNQLSARQPRRNVPEASKVIANEITALADVDIAATPTGWVVVWADGNPSSLFARALGADGSPQGAAVPVGDPGDSVPDPRSPAMEPHSYWLSLVVASRPPRPSRRST